MGAGGWMRCWRNGDFFQTSGWRIFIRMGQGSRDARRTWVCREWRSPPARLGMDCQSRAGWRWREKKMGGGIGGSRGCEVEGEARARGGGGGCLGVLTRWGTGPGDMSSTKIKAVGQGRNGVNWKD